MGAVVMAQEATLRRRLTHSVQRYPSSTKLEWLMATQTITGYGVTKQGNPTTASHYL